MLSNTIERFLRPEGELMLLCARPVRYVRAQPSRRCGAWAVGVDPLRVGAGYRQTLGRTWHRARHNRLSGRSSARTLRIAQAQLRVELL